jgi:hypothetical protein
MMSGKQVTSSDKETSSSSTRNGSNTSKAYDNHDAAATRDEPTIWHISRWEYIRIFMLVHIQLHPSTSADSALIDIEADWKNDIAASLAMDSVAAVAPTSSTSTNSSINPNMHSSSGGGNGNNNGGGLSRSGLHRSLCQLADHWTVTVDLDEYVHLLTMRLLLLRYHYCISWNA